MEDYDSHCAQLVSLGQTSKNLLHSGYEYNIHVHTACTAAMSVLTIQYVRRVTPGPDYVIQGLYMYMYMFTFQIVKV